MAYSPSVPLTVQIRMAANFSAQYRTARMICRIITLRLDLTRTSITRKIYAGDDIAEDSNGAEVVSTDWILDSLQAGTFVSKKSYIITGIPPPRSNWSNTLLISD